MNALRQSGLEDLSLQSPLQEILDLQRKHIIQLHPRLIEHTDSHKTTNKSISFEETFWVFSFEFEELTSSTTNLG
jgi:hypothetical protein